MACPKAKTRDKDEILGGTGRLGRHCVEPRISLFSFLSFLSFFSIFLE